MIAERQTIPGFARASRFFVVTGFLVISAALFRSGLFATDQVLLASDLIRYFEPASTLFFQTWMTEGQVPLWNPYEYAGFPWIGGERMLFLYPPSWLLLIVPGGAGWAALLIVHLAAAGAATYGLLRSRRCSPGGAFLGGLVFELGGPVVGHAFAGHMGFVMAAPYLPLSLWLLTRICRRARWRDGLALGASLSAFALLGALELALLYLAYAVVLGVLLSAVARGTGARRAPSWARRASPRGRAVAVFALSVVMAAGLGAIRWFPLIEGVQHWPESSKSPAESAVFSLGARDLGRGVLPFLTAEPPRPGSSDADAGFFWEFSWYCGALPLALALLAAVTMRRRPSLHFALSLVLGLTLFAFGSSTPVYGFVAGLLPGLDRFQVPGRVLLLLILVLAWLAAQGWDRLGSARRKGRTRVVAGMLGGLCLLAFIGALAAASEGALSSSLLPLIAVQSIGCGAFLLWVSASNRPPRKSVLFGVGSAVVLTQLLWPSWTLFDTAPREAVVSPPEKIVAHLSEHSGKGRLLDLSHLVPTSVTLPRRIPSLLGYEKRAPSSLVPVVNLLYGPQNSDSTRIRTQELERVREHQIMELLQVRFVASRRKLAPGGPLELRATDTLRKETIDASGRGLLEIPLYLYENVTATPFAYFVKEARFFPDPSKIKEELRFIEPERYVCLAAPLEPDEAAPWTAPLAKESPVEVERQTTGKLLLRASNPQPRTLVISQLYDPGWQATVDGQPVPLRRANGALQSLFLPAGQHEITLEYQPTSYLVGRTITWLSVTAALTALLIGLGLRWRHFLRSGSKAETQETP